MKNFPFRVLFLSIFLPPICYVLTLQVLEGYLQGREKALLDRVAVENYDALYEGRYTVEEEINRNLGEYLKKSARYKLGIRMEIHVKTETGRILYPVQYRKGMNERRIDDEFSNLPTKSLK